MAKKTTIQDIYEDDDDIEVVSSKKKKRKLAKAASKAQQQQQAPVEEGDDTMSKIALLCQDLRWREAVSLCLSSLEKFRAEGKKDMVMTLEMALPKLEFSLRRQQATALIIGSKSMLKKEYLLDVGE